MNTIVILSLSTLTVTGLAFIHETRLRRAVHNVLRRLVQSYRNNTKARDQLRDGE